MDGQEVIPNLVEHHPPRKTRLFIKKMNGRVFILGCKFLASAAEPEPGQCLLLKRADVMKHKTINTVMLAGITGLLLACNAKQEGSTAVKEEPAVVIDKEQIKKEIQAKEDEFAATYNSGVLKEIGYYAEDAVSFYQNRPPLVGRKAIAEFLAADLASNSNKISFKTNEVFVSNDGNLVVEVGSFRVVDSANTPVNTGNYMSVFEKRNGKYVTVRDMSASDMPN
jgi:ketosteroid isomerase-like protein